MMDIWDINKIALFIIFFVPGFISIKIFNLFIPSERRDFSKSFFETIGYSSINFALLSWLIILIHSGAFPEKHKIWYFIFLFFIIFLAPIFWPILFLKLSTIKFIAKRILHPIQKPWDYVFNKRESYWVIVHLIDGRRVGGKYDIKSFASSFPAEEQIYIEEVWKLDENSRFIAAIERSKGIIILGKEILALEFFK